MHDLQVTFTGRVPLVIHNVRLANPLDPYAKQLRAVTSKRGKTEDDHLAIMRIEWEGGMYHDDRLGPYLPCSHVVACLRQAGAITRHKTALVRAMVVSAEDGGERLPLEYDGPRSIDDLWELDEHRDVRMVKVSQARTLRTRPRFPEWAVTFRALVDEEQMDADVFESICQRAGRNIGLGESAEGARARFAVEVKALEPVA